MRQALVALLLALPLAAEGAARVPLCVLAEHSLQVGDDRTLPLATIGAAPAGSQPLPSFLALVPYFEGTQDGATRTSKAAEDLVQSLTEGTLKLRAPQPGAHALLFLVGPMLNSGERWEPTALSREGRTLALVITSWRDNGPRRRNVPVRPTILMTLGELPAGDYELAITYRGMFLDVEAKESRYGMNDLQHGELPFHIVATPESGDEAVTLPQGALRVAAIERTVPNAQRPSAGAYRLEAPDFESSRASVAAGTFDLAAWARADDRGKKPAPVLSPPGENGPVYACVTGPALNSMEWMSLGDVTWTDEGVRLRVEVWRDNGARDRNAPYVPLLVIPLDRPSKAGTYRVDVEWTTLRADAPGGLYRLEHDPLLEPLQADFEVR